MSRIFGFLGNVWDKIKNVASNIGGRIGKGLRPIMPFVKKVSHGLSFVPGKVGVISGIVNRVARWLFPDEPTVEEPPDTPPQRANHDLKQITYDPPIRGGRIVEPEDVVDVTPRRGPRPAVMPDNDVNNLIGNLRGLGGPVVDKIIRGLDVNRGFNVRPGLAPLLHR